jgi:hypothetical protein
MPQLVCFSYTKGSDLLNVQAIVEDAVQIAPATDVDPPQFGSALCQAVLLWDDPITPENAPTREQVERMLAWITDWVAVPPIEFADE